MTDFSQRYRKSLQYLAKAIDLTPGGAQTLSKMPRRFPLGAHPVALASGKGAYVTDVDGNRYFDMICALASMTLGYNHPGVDRAVYLQMTRGVSFSLPTVLESELAERLTHLIPCAEMTRFVKTGSEATEAAIRVARRYTQRPMILTVGEGYHSWHSWFQAVKPEHPGIPSDYRNMVRPFPYNDLEAAKANFAYMGHNIAAVILEPCHYEAPKPGFLEGLRELCTAYGSVLIFDEMVTGFRWDLGGGQEFFNVTPDLACFGKACANGYPLAFLTGKRELMEDADVVSGTFGGEALSLTACLATIDAYERDGVIDKLHSNGAKFRSALTLAIEEEGLPAIVDGYTVKPRIQLAVPEEKKAQAMSLFVQEMALRGILWHPAGGNITAAADEPEMVVAAQRAAESLRVVEHAYRNDDWSALQGHVITPALSVRQEVRQ